MISDSDGSISPTARNQCSRSRPFGLPSVSLQEAPEDSDPFDKLVLASEGKNGNQDKRKDFTTAEVLTLLDEARKRKDVELTDVIEMGMWSGARIEEICALKVEKVNLKDHSMGIADAKTPAGWRTVPIHSELMSTIKRLIGSRKAGYVLSGLTPNKYGDRSNAVGKRFGHLKTALGFGEQHVFHSIRKTVATLLENAGVPENVAADIIGHEKPTMTYGLYSGGASLKVKREAIERLSYGAA